MIYLDTNVVVRHLTGDPPGQSIRATAYLAGSHELVLTDVIVAEIVCLLESTYRLPRSQVAALARAIIAFESVVVTDAALLVRALDVYEVDRLDFAEAYLVACAEVSGVGEIASFDRAIDRVPSVRRREPR